MEGENIKRLRFNVPDDDVSVLEWLKKQKNASHSIRVLIRSFISQNGYVDVTCLPVKKKAGEDKHVASHQPEVVEKVIEKVVEPQKEIPQKVVVENEFDRQSTDMLDSLMG